MKSWHLQENGWNSGCYVKQNKSGLEQTPHFISYANSWGVCVCDERRRIMKGKGEEGKQGGSEILGKRVGGSRREPGNRRPEGDKGGRKERGVNKNKIFHRYMKII